MSRSTATVCVLSTHDLPHCFARLSAAAAELLHLSASSSATLRVSWTVHSSHAPAVAGGGSLDGERACFVQFNGQITTHGPSRIEISAAFCRLNGVSADVVAVALYGSVETAKTVVANVQTASDWALLNAHSESVQDALLSQSAVVYPGMLLPIWLDPPHPGYIVISVRSARTTNKGSGIIPVLLRADSDVEVLPPPEGPPRRPAPEATPSERAADKQPNTCLLPWVRCRVAAWSGCCDALSGEPHVGACARVSTRLFRRLVDASSGAGLTPGSDPGPSAYLALAEDRLVCLIRVRDPNPMADATESGSAPGAAATRLAGEAHKPTPSVTSGGVAAANLVAVWDCPQACHFDAEGDDCVLLLSAPAMRSLCTEILVGAFQGEPETQRALLRWRAGVRVWVSLCEISGPAATRSRDPDTVKITASPALDKSAMGTWNTSLATTLISEAVGFVRIVAQGGAVATRTPARTKGSCDTVFSVHRSGHSLSCRARLEAGRVSLPGEEPCTLLDCSCPAAVFRCSSIDGGAWWELRPVGAGWPGCSLGASTDVDPSLAAVPPRVQLVTADARGSSASGAETQDDVFLSGLLHPSRPVTCPDARSDTPAARLSSLVSDAVDVAFEERRCATTSEAVSSHTDIEGRGAGDALESLACSIELQLTTAAALPAAGETSPEASCYVLLVGPSGSGRTLALRLVARRLGRRGIHAEMLDCSTLVGLPLAAVSEGLVAAWVACWLRPHAVLLLDNLDALAPQLGGDGAGHDPSGAEAVDAAAAAMSAGVTALLASLATRGGAAAERLLGRRWREAADCTPPARPLAAPMRSTCSALIRMLTASAVSERCRPQNAPVGTIPCVATACDASALHSNLRVPGRFDRVLRIPALSARDDRARLLRSLVDRWPAAESSGALEAGYCFRTETIPWPEVAAEVDGYSSADLARGVAAAWSAAVAAACSIELRELTRAPVAAVVVTLRQEQLRAGLVAAMPEGIAAASRGGSSGADDAAAAAWEDLRGGLGAARRAIEEVILLPTRHPAAFADVPVRLPTGILLYGAPGCGKSALAAAAAGHCGVRLVRVRGPELLGKYVGQSEAAVRAAFQRAAAAAPCVLLLDGLDAIAPRRGSADQGGSSGVADRVVNQILSVMDGVEVTLMRGVFVIATTSRPDLVDPALLRAGRLDLAVECPIPSPADRADILAQLSRRVPALSEDAARLLNLLAVCEECDGCTGADLRGLITSANIAATREAVESGRTAAGGTRVSIEARHVEEAARALRPSLSRRDRGFYAATYKAFAGSRVAGNDAVAVEAQSQSLAASTAEAAVLPPPPTALGRFGVRQAQA